MIDRDALHDVLAEHVHAEPPLGCPILGALAVGADALAIGATTASLDAARARRLRHEHDNGNCEPPCSFCGEVAA